MELLCKWAGRAGLSGMDAARAAMGQGWPFDWGPPRSGPWSNDGTKGVSRSETRMSGVLSLWLLSLCTGRRSASKEKVTRREGEKHDSELGRYSVDFDGEEAKLFLIYKDQGSLIERPCKIYSTPIRNTEPPAFYSLHGKRNDLGQYRTS